MVLRDKNILPEQEDAFRVASSLLGSKEARTHGIWRRVPYIKGIRPMCQNKYVICSNGDMVIRENIYKKECPPKILKMHKHDKYFEIGKCYVHRMMASAFFENYDENLHINHIDANTFNNSISNLEQVTPRQNTQDFWLSKNTDVVKKRNRLIEQRKDWVTMHKGDAQIRVPSRSTDEYANSGWEFGVPDSLKIKFQNRLWVNDKNKDYLIYAEELDNYILKGYEVGRIKGLNGIKIKCIETGEIFQSMRDASEKLNICTDTISKSIKKNCTVGRGKYTFIEVS